MVSREIDRRIPTAAKLIAVAILISVFSAANSNVLTCPRVYYAMANDGLFFKKLAEVHPRFKTPSFAIVAGSAWGGVLALSGTFNELLTYVVFGGWLFYGLAAATIFVYRKRLPAAERTYRVPGYPWTPLLFIIAAIVLVVNTLVTQLLDQPRKTLIAVGIIALGILAWLAFDGFKTSTLNWQSFSQVAFAFRVTPALLVVGTLYALVMGVVGGLFPAVRAARIPISAALREL